MKQFKNVVRNSMIVLFLAFLLVACSREKPHNVHTVEIIQMKFVPEELHVVKGDTVIFLNKDIVAHDATEEPAQTWTSGPLQTGESWSMVASESADYFCSIHVVMKGKLLVAE